MEVIMKKYVILTLISLFTVGAAMAQTAYNGYYGQTGPNRGNHTNVHPGHSAPRGHAYGHNRGPRGPAYGYNSYNTGSMSACGTVAPAYTQTRVVYQACNTPGYRWHVTEGYYWVPGYWAVEPCGTQVWVPGRYEWRVITRDRVRYSACGW